ncbi:MAG TPA: MogA/MoaB family molybdenum cofactor biosynthesis protein [Candidatus Acidoferrales bacterium]|nr:MogA/MoaB family molybdenum cofactor biosynthesis protein [Candidatus Acidoferrales bacterium]
MRVVIITVSDSVSRGTREDRSGAALRKRCEELGWKIAAAEILADEQGSIREALIRVCDSGVADLVLTTGGTGLGPRDVTPEATEAACSRLVPGLGERMREVGGRGFARAYLSRATAGVRGSTLVVNLPGSPKGAVESLDAVAELLPHAVEVLRGAHHD